MIARKGDWAMQFCPWKTLLIQYAEKRADRQTHSLSLLSSVLGISLLLLLLPCLSVGATCLPLPLPAPVERDL